MACNDTLAMLVGYKAWAEEIAFASALALPPGEALKSRPTTFGNITMTLNHIHVVDDIFRHHLLGLKHGYTFRNTDEIPDLELLRERAIALNHWFAAELDSWTDAQRAETVEFGFVEGRTGSMTREQILLHLVNHSTYHRGFVGDMLRQVPFHWPASDLTIFIRDHWNG